MGAHHGGFERRLIPSAPATTPPPAPVAAPPLAGMFPGMHLGIRPGVCPFMASQPQFQCTVGI